jgi:hypothetical protein
MVEDLQPLPNTETGLEGEVLKPLLMVCPGNKVKKDGEADCAAHGTDGGYRILAATAAPVRKVLPGSAFSQV